uniref:Secreted protein n=1 Tax=Prolemur simus TaxID=1328070 RepID=A0A8C9DJK5_PROSS
MLSISLCLLATCVSSLEECLFNVRQLSTQGQIIQLCELINKVRKLLAKKHMPSGHCAWGSGYTGIFLGGPCCFVCEFFVPGVPDFETLFSQVYLCSIVLPQLCIATLTTASWQGLCKPRTHSLNPINPRSLRNYHHTKGDVRKVKSIFLMLYKDVAMILFCMS